MNNVIGRFAHLDPAPIMMIQPTIDMAQDYSKSRIAPMLRDTKVLNNLFFTVKNKEDIPTAKTRDSNNTILSKIFPGGRLIMCGSNSPAGLASRPVRVLLADEVDRFQASAGTEGDPVDLASKRMTTFWKSINETVRINSFYRKVVGGIIAVVSAVTAIWNGIAQPISVAWQTVVSIFENGTDSLAAVMLDVAQKTGAPAEVIHAIVPAVFSAAQSMKSAWETLSKAMGNESGEMRGR